jgi:chorismate lyase/3-hydroxybenzoate synthase
MDSGHAVFGVSYETGTAADWLSGDPGVLAVFEFGASPLKSTDSRHVPVALEPLDSPARLEVWRARGPFETGQLHHLRFVRGMDFTMGHIPLDLRQYKDMREASRLAYEALQDFLGRSPHHWPLKIWNYIPGINQGSGDGECYRQFCVGRAEALAAGYGDQPPMPAATAIGSPAAEPALQVYFLAGALPGLNVENPRQVNAWQYPRQYGPRSPLFSRGTVLQGNGDTQFFISGTASVVGHQSQHDTAGEQIRESLRNVEALLQEARRLTGRRFNTDSGTGVLKVYVRQADELASIRAVLDQGWPSSLNKLCLRGDICRGDLLTEVDGIIPGLPATAADD